MTKEPQTVPSERRCKFHNYEHPYVRHVCGCEYCPHSWISCPRCYGTHAENRQNRQRCLCGAAYDDEWTGNGVHHQTHRCARVGKAERPMTKEQTVISVICRPPDKRIHIAPTERGLGASSFTLCLQKWTRRELCYVDSELCPECVQKWKEKGKL